MDEDTYERLVREEMEAIAAALMEEQRRINRMELDVARRWRGLEYVVSRPTLPGPLPPDERFDPTLATMTRDADT